MIIFCVSILLKLESEFISSSNKNMIKKNNRDKQISNLKVSSDFNLSKDIINHKGKEKMETQIIYENFEINNITYKEALKGDKRTYCQYYLSLIKEKHIIIFTFNKNENYNPYIIKICLFFLLFALYIFINTLFFNDSAIHKIFEDKGIFHLNYTLPQIIYSIIICSIFNAILKRIYLSQNDILKIKYEKNIDSLNSKIIIVIKYLKIKFICFFLINILFLIFFGLYLSSFCFVYRNTKIYLFKVISTSYAFSFIFPFIIYLIPGIFRISSLREPGKCFYQISKIIQLL